MKRCLLLLLFLFLATVVGCGNKLTYANVKGTVTYNGKPIDKGQIVFTAEGKPPTIIDIDDGKFTGQAVVGSNRISVSALKKSTVAPKPLPKEAEIQLKGYKEFMRGKSDGGGPSGVLAPVGVDYIPPEWGSDSKHIRVVEAGAANEFEFNIKGPS